MKTLERIDTPQEGFVYKLSKGEFKEGYEKGGWIEWTFKDCLYVYAGENKEAYGLVSSTILHCVGKLGITHELIDGKLVKIPRDDIAVDDIWEHKIDGKQILITEKLPLNISEVHPMYENKIQLFDIYIRENFKRVGIATQPIQWIKTEGE